MDEVAPGNDNVRVHVVAELERATTERAAHSLSSTNSRGSAIEPFIADAAKVAGLER